MIRCSDTARTKRSLRACNRAKTADTGRSNPAARAAQGSTVAIAVASALTALRDVAPQACLAFLGATLASGVLAADVVNDKLGAPRDFDIPAQPLGTALKQLADQAGIQIFYEERIVEGLQAPAIKAQFTTIQALSVLLHDTPLEFVASNETVAVRQKSAPAAEPGAVATRTSELRLAQASTTRSQETASPVVAPEEIIVTARKRAESFLDVPVVANIVTQQDLERTKVDDMFSLATRVPSLLMGNGVAATGTQVSLRGIGTTATNPTMDNSISLNVDGVSLSQGTAYGVGMFDVAQVEVLKGPQALFFGKNSPAGVISLRSADPTDKFELITRVGYEREAKEKEAEVIVSGPVSESLKLRLAGHFADHEGFFENKAVALPGSGAIDPGTRKYAPTEEWIVRGTALWEPTERFTARLKLNYAEANVTGGSSPFNQVAYCPDGTGPVPGTNIPFLEGEDCKADHVIRRPWFDPAAFPVGLPNGGVPYEDNEQLLGSLELNWVIGDSLNLTSVSGYYDNAYDALMQGTTSSTTQLLANIFTFDNEQFTQELRLTSDFQDSPVNFMVGAFYQDGEMKSTLRLGGNSAFNLAPVLQDVLNVVDIRSFSLFGQAIWDITPQLELAAGARWTDEKRKHKEYNFNPGQGVPIGRVDRIDPKVSSSNVSPEVTLTYKPLDTLTVFGSYKQGFKSGSFSGLAYTPPTTPASFDDEKVRGGELGLRTVSPDRRFSASAAVYYFRYTDLQVGALELSTATGGNLIPLVRTMNAASAAVKGIELDATFAPAAVEGLTLNAALNYNRARYRSFPNVPCGNGQTIGAGCDQMLNPSTGRYTAQDLSGKRLVRAPDWSGYLGFTQDIFMSNGMKLTIGAGANYVSEYTTVLVDLPGFEQDDYVKVDANVALRSANDRWEFALIGRNLTNEYTIGRCANDNAQNGQLFGGQISGGLVGGPAGEDEASCFVDRGRQLWARLSFSF